MRIETLLVLGLETICVCTSANAETVARYAPVTKTEQMLFGDDPKTWASPKVVVPPTYPAELIASGVSGYVDVDVTTNESGAVTAHRIVASKPASAILEAAVAETIGKWLFYVPISNDCKPLVATANVRVWFEIKNGVGSVSVSGQPTPDARSPFASAQRAKMINAKDVFPRYPRKASRDRIQADAGVIMQVRAASGEVISASMPWIKTSGGGEDIFRDALVSQYAKARFEPREGSDYAVCVQVGFKIGL